MNPVNSFEEMSKVSRLLRVQISSGNDPLSAFEERFKLSRLLRVQVSSGNQPVRKFEDRSNSSSESDNKGDNMNSYSPFV